MWRSFKSWARGLSDHRGRQPGAKGLCHRRHAEIGVFVFLHLRPHAHAEGVENAAKTSGQYSFEARMACGFGACMGCSIQTKNGYKRICKDGPVLEREELLWQN